MILRRSAKRTGNNGIKPPPWILTALCFLVIACSGGQIDEGRIGSRGASTTFEKLLVRAEQEDPVAQNLIGYMLYFGEGAPQDFTNARYWFERAARHAHAGALLNLAVILYTGAGAPRDRKAALRYYERWRSASGPGETGAVGTTLAETIEQFRKSADATVPPGQSDYERFCAGCHGLNGIATYVDLPSFAISERLDKTDRRLLASIEKGHGLMPAWGDLLDEEAQTTIVGYIRTFPERYRKGVALPPRAPPEYYFTFGLMRNSNQRR